MPGMLLKNGALLGPIGTQGGDGQAQVQLQLITNLVDYGMNPQAAIEAPRWISGGPTPDSGNLLTLENRFTPQLETDLVKRGHEVAWTAPFDPKFGHAQMILIDEASGALVGGADPRADGVALGY